MRRDEILFRDGHLHERAVMAGAKSTRERESEPHVSTARGHKVEEPGGRVSSSSDPSTADPLSPVTLRPLAGPQGYRPSRLPSHNRSSPSVTDPIGARTTWPFPRLNNAARRGEHRPGGGEPPSAPDRLPPAGEVLAG